MKHQLTLLIVSIAAQGYGHPTVEYDYATARAKLLEIGQKLQHYRQSKGFKPVALRKTVADCGLPQSLTELCREQGQPWSLPSDMSTFRVPLPAKFNRDSKVQFDRLYWDKPHLVARLGSMSHLFSERGEDLPIMADYNMWTASDILGGPNSQGPHIMQALVLRLNGTVDLVTFDRKVPFDLLRK